ncbi:MAG: hypothetical protein MUE64_00435 [Ignavibacteriaceae bacterium]|jgi:hypothetical protein|nr:hypothetical protein [Ignavibacteriaceae bacterium]
MKISLKRFIGFNSPKLRGFFLLISGLLIITISCVNLKNTNPKKLPFEIIFGKSGGFTNISMEYKIYENGDVYKIQNNGNQKINSISKSKIKTIRDWLLDSDFEHLKIAETGNITYFITVKSDKYENTVKWNDSSNNDQLKNLYKDLLTTIKP